jgi:hypothetical protein
MEIKMPCYCDTPDDDDQIEIERRCKVNMYFDAQAILTHKQIEECDRRNLKQFPMDDINNHLCKICQILTKQQMESILAIYFLIKWKHKTLYDWYVQHCKDDENNL